ncbi:uncharacterized protein LACBIDRAFT_186606 [Laccaria bicolor S238N-H82]|uniref:Predicted protein n=1 Tax=Laccaria bicolor (strain S238N-H82 / ATCC MYA-4686) TaxID=486041 RepID=B0E0J2_LACBS|nr:uncharacterized protein LACBIDRAFT_186606 [Laccaria bicolor S238N-H82]EDQ99630.1 predicted protein [Laccaria bicolor S238N-H82]|eukprot:XP_001889741.1 predicted protein [Laccaria bicolor S238N-H82]
MESDSPPEQRTQAQAEDILSLLSTAEYNDKHLEESLQDIVRETGWYENLAAAVLDSLENIVRGGAPVAGAMTDAVGKATGAAIGFAKEHPVFCTIVALGVLVLLAPWAIEAFGFGELGPIEGTFAAAWQARYAGYVPKGSLFSFFQRLGMVWGAKVHHVTAVKRCED